MKIMDTPYTREQIEDQARHHKGRIRGVVAVPWYELLGRDQDSWEEEMCRKLTGSGYGLIDLVIRVVGSLGDDILFEISGDVTHLLDNYEAAMAEEATPEVGERIHGVDVGKVIALAKRQIIEAGLHLQVRTFAELHDHCDANLLGFSDGEHLADGTAFSDLGTNRAVDVMNRVQAIIDAWLRSGQARRQTEGGNHGS